jgi:voltage-gated potassium channel
MKWLLRPALGVKVAILVVAALFYGASGYIYFEQPLKPELSWQDGMWWSLVTMATVGYGDYFPVSAGGRYLVAAPIILLGLSFLALAMSNFASFFIRADALNRKGLSMFRLQKHVIVINHPSTDVVARVAHELRAQLSPRPPIVLIDESLPELPPALADDDIHFVRGSVIQASTYERACLAAATRVIVLAQDPQQRSSDAATTAACLTVKSLRRDVHLVAECVDGASEEVLARTGCDSVVCVASLAPGILAHETTDPGVAAVLHELTAWSERVNSIYVVPLALRSTAATVADLRRWGESRSATLLGVRRGERVDLNPAGDRPLVSGDAAVVLCRSRPEAIEIG